MSSRFDCRDCGAPIAYEEWDGGSEAYCPICGKPNLVPMPDGRAAAAAARPPAESVGRVGGSGRTAAPPPVPEVFRTEGPGDPDGRVVGRVDCPRCNAAVPVTASDYGHSTYCPACGGEVPVGEALVVAEATTRTMPAPPGAPRPTVPGGPGGRGRSAGAWLFGLAALGVSAGLAVFAARQPARPAPRPAPRAPARAPDAFLTLDAIDALARQEPPDEALVRAQEWRTLLLEAFHAPPADPRLARLDEVIRGLEARLEPKPASDPPEVAAFQAAFKALLQALKALPADRAADLDALQPARRAIEEADALLAAHPDTLEPFAGHYDRVKAQVAAMVARAEGSRAIVARLESARTKAEAGQPTEALEELARARLGAVTAELDTARRDDLGKRVEGLVGETIPMALCLRSLDEAERSAQTGDHAARDWLAQQARAHFHRALRRTDVDPEAILERITALEEAAKGEAPGGVPPADLLVRKEYEDALRDFAIWPAAQVDPWRDAALAFQAIARRMPSAWSGRRETCRALALGGLRAAVESAPDSRAATVLSAVRRGLDGLPLWKDSAAWAGLSAEVRRKGSALARAALERAETLAGGDGLDRAIAAAEEAATLAPDPDFARKATDRAESLRKEAALRADRRARDDAWARLRQTAEGPDPVDAWNAAADFERRFKEGPTAGDLGKLRASVEAALRATLPARLDECAALDRAGRHRDFRRRAAALATVPIPPDLEARWQAIRTRDAALGREADALFGRINPSLTRPDKVVDVLDRLDAVLALAPQHAGALALRAKARERGGRYVGELLQTAELLQKHGRLAGERREAQRKRLNAILKLQPDGPTADRARALLKDLGG